MTDEDDVEDDYEDNEEDVDDNDDKKWVKIEICIFWWTVYAITGWLVGWLVGFSYAKFCWVISYSMARFIEYMWDKSLCSVVVNL